MKCMIGEMKKKDQDQPILNLLLAAISVMLPDIEMANVNKGRALHIYILTFQPS